MELNENHNKFVDCTKLEVGMEVKNYKEMCELLNQDIKGGDSKKSQIKQWQCYFDFEKQGQKYIITEIFDEPFPNIDARKAKRGIYVGYIELLLMDYLAKQANHCTSITKRELYQILGMTSNSYFENKWSVQGVTENMGKSKNSGYQYPVSCQDVQVFYSRADSKLNDIINSALKSMENRFLIKFSTEYVICYSDVEGTHQFKIADNSEVEMILQAQRRAIEKMGYYSFSQVIRENKVKKYFSYVDSYLHEKYGWNYAYSQLKIIYLADSIRKQFSATVDEIRKLSNKDKRIKLNQEVIKALDIQAQNQYDKSLVLNDDMWGEPNPMDNNSTCNEKYDINYVEIQKQLSDYLVKIENNKNISKTER